MLEHSSLLLHGWIRTTLLDGELAWIRAISDVDAHSLGFVRFVGDPKGSWFSWLRKVRLDVYETEDASHLLSLSRSWSMLRIWEVDDADDRHVGTVYTKNIVSSDGDRLGAIDRENRKVLDPRGQLLAQYETRNGDNLELIFMPESPANPFLRMMILGCVLALDPGPKP